MGLALLVNGVLQRHPGVQQETKLDDAKHQQEEHRGNEGELHERLPTPRTPLGGYCVAATMSRAWLGVSTMGTSSDFAPMSSPTGAWMRAI